MQEVSGVYTTPFVDTDELKMALRARKVSGAFEKRAPAFLFQKWFDTFLWQRYILWTSASLFPSRALPK